MKKQLLTFISAITATIAFSQSIPNGGFENWTTTTIENPQLWMCSNDEGNQGVYAPPTATKTTDAWHGTYAIKLSCFLYGPNNDTSKAWVANGNPGGNTGGIPYSQRPSGIRFYYKLNLAPGDSSITLAIFKLNGNVIGQYFYKIGANQSAYTLFSQTFSPALTQTPDTVIFACAASDLMTHKGYPGTTLQIDSVSFTGVSSQPANMNADFELWQNNSRYKANGWNGQGQVQTTDKFSGSYAMELITNPPGFGDNQIQVGNITDGIPTQSSTLGGYPFSNQIDTLIFYYKYLPANYPLSTDSAQVNVCFKKNGNYISCYGKLLPYAGSYKKVEMPFNLGQVPDTLLLYANSSKWPALNSYVGSDLKIDEVYLKSQKVPVSDFIMPSTGCKGVPVHLTDNSTNMPSSWLWITTGSSQSSYTVQNPVLTYNSTGTFTVSLQAADSFGTGGFQSKIITIYNNPVITATSATVCGGNTATLNATGANTYTWNLGSTGSTYTASPSVSTTYTVVGTSIVGCSGSTSASIFVPTPATPDICMVTVDSTSTNNIIYWNKTLYNNVDSFIVYREVSTGTYARITSVSKDSLSEYIDIARNIGPANGDPNIGSYRYKLQIRDTCGKYSPLGNYHNTVKITDQHNGTFQWNTYDVEGQATPVANFILERDNANNNIWSPIGTVSGTQISLTDGSYNTYQTIANWRVQATGFNCTPTMRLGNNSTQSAIVKSKSNISNNRTTGISNSKVVLGIYPNPSAGIFTITLSVSHATADVYDLAGKKVASFTLQSNTSQIDLGNLSNGTYFINVITSNGIYHEKINKTN